MLPRLRPLLARPCSHDKHNKTLAGERYGELVLRCAESGALAFVWWLACYHDAAETGEVTVVSSGACFTDGNATQACHNLMLLLKTGGRRQLCRCCQVGVAMQACSLPNHCTSVRWWAVLGVQRVD
jgi:hypothetical protein